MLLAIDTSTRSLGIALYDGVRLLDESTWISKNHHTVELAPAIAGALARQNSDASALRAIGVAIGPGSFTGLRIGLAFAKGLVLSRHLPLIGVSTLDGIAASQPPHPALRLAAVLEAGRRRLAIGWYAAPEGRWQLEGDLLNLTIEEFADSLATPALVCGELSGEARQRLEQKGMIVPSPAQCVRRSAVLAELAWMRWKAGQIDNPATLTPIYLHHGEPIPG